MKITVVFFSLLLGYSLWGVELKGRVVDSETRVPLAGVEIRVTGLSDSVVSDQHGFFSFENLDKGHYHLTTIFPGYRSLDLIVELQADDTRTLPLEIHKVGYSEEMTVTATRAVERMTPVVFTDVSSRTIEEEHTVEDLPMLLMGLPNVYSYSDDGSGMGYSYLKIRGFDQTRIGVMINGIPLNDPEDHQVYWVDMPDFAESLNGVQIQRGVGSSLYGVDTFGGSVNMETIGESGNEIYQLVSQGGSYDTQKYGLSGEIPLKNGLQLTFRGSYLKSDGYRENSGVEQWSAYLSLASYGARSVTRFITYTGNELAHAAWEASPQSVLEENHRHNPITYTHTVDDFTQPHYELHHTLFISDSMYWKNTVFAIVGKGYYEQYKYGRDMFDYGLWSEGGVAPESDIIRQKWVAKKQYGWISELGRDHASGKATMGMYLSTYHANHWGEVDQLLDLELPLFEPGFVYHKYFSHKQYVTAYLNELFRPTPSITLMFNLHYQHISYDMEQQQVGNFQGENLHSLEVNYGFFNPRMGINVNVNQKVNLFANVSLAHREPTDSQLFDTWKGPDDLGVAPLFNHAERIVQGDRLVRLFWTDPQVKEERMMDYEAGVNYTGPRMALKMNLFFMDFHDEIVPYGQVDDDGFPVRGNADKTVHRGLEISGKFQLNSRIELDTNLSLNDNYYKSFIYKEYDWNTGSVLEKDFSGNSIAGFPETIANLTLTYRNSAIAASLRAQYFGRQFLDNTGQNTRSIDSSHLFNAWLKWNLPRTGRLDQIELNLRVNNLSDEKNYTAGYYDAWAGENYLWPGAERNASLGMRLRY